MTVMFTLQLMAALPATVTEPFIEFGCVDDAIPRGTHCRQACSLISSLMRGLPGNFTPPLSLVDGGLQLPEGLGWGNTVDLDGAQSIVFQ